MEDLSEELVIDILSRLWVKTIIHCKCVCKKWRNLVLESSFVNLHLSKSPRGIIIHHNPRIDRRTDDDEEWTEDPGSLKWVEIGNKVDHHHLHQHPLTIHLNLAPVLQNAPISLVGSVNGLICLWQSCSKLDNTYICNPITREIIIFPRPRYYKQGYAVIFYGFGVNSLTGEYKVVRIFQGDMVSYDETLSRPSVLEAEVYTLGTCQWRSIGRVPYWLNGFNGFNRCHGLFLNNHCHWIVCDQRAPEKICSFDLDKEMFQLFPSPPPTEAVRRTWFHFQSLAVLKGCLCKVDSHDYEFTIWVMKEYGIKKSFFFWKGIKKSWHREVVIKPGVSRGITWMLQQPMYLIEGLEDRSFLIVSHKSKLLAYCPKSDTIKDTKFLKGCSTLLTHRPSFLKLQNFELERVQMF